MHFRLWPESLVNLSAGGEEDDEECGFVFVDVDLVNSLLLEVEAGHRGLYDTINGFLLGFACFVAKAAVRAFLAFACIEDEYELAHGPGLLELCEGLCRCSTPLAFNAVGQWRGPGRL